MTIGGWITMFLAVGGVTAFFAWMLYLTLSRRDPVAMHSLLEETPDTREE